MIFASGKTFNIVSILKKLSKDLSIISFSFSEELN
jgi:hypothetical protein